VVHLFEPDAREFYDLRSSSGDVETRAAGRRVESRSHVRRWPRLSATSSETRGWHVPEQSEGRGAPPIGVPVPAKRRRHQFIPSRWVNPSYCGAHLADGRLVWRRDCGKLPAFRQSFFVPTRTHAHEHCRRAPPSLRRRMGRVAFPIRRLASTNPPHCRTLPTCWIWSAKARTPNSATTRRTWPAARQAPMRDLRACGGGSDRPAGNRRHVPAAGNRRARLHQLYGSETMAHRTTASGPARFALGHRPVEPPRTYIVDFLLAECGQADARGPYFARP